MEHGAGLNWSTSYQRFCSAGKARMEERSRTGVMEKPWARLAASAETCQRRHLLLAPGDKNGIFSCSVSAYPLLRPSLWQSRAQNRPPDPDLSLVPQSVTPTDTSAVIPACADMGLQVSVALSAGCSVRVAGSYPLIELCGNACFLCYSYCCRSRCIAIYLQ